MISEFGGYKSTICNEVFGYSHFVDLTKLLQQIRSAKTGRIRDANSGERVLTQGRMAVFNEMSIGGHDGLSVTLFKAGLNPGDAQDMQGC